MADFPYRIRLHGGRNTHAARVINADPASLVTACHYTNGPKDKLLRGDAAVTCRECHKEMTR